MASLELLDALSTGAHTTTTVATARGITRAETTQQLSAATTRGFIAWENDQHRFTDVDADRRFAHLSTTGLQELHRLQQQAPDADR